jgi:hypothetical protein
MFHTISLHARAECMHDVGILLNDLLDDTTVTRFLHAYSAKNSEFGEGMLELHFRCPEERRTPFTNAIQRLVAHVRHRADNDDLHVLGQTLNFSDDFDGSRALDDDLERRILHRLSDKLTPRSSPV